MQDVLEFILKNITVNPNDVQVSSQDVDGSTNYTIAVHPDDVGRVIGKEGKVIKAIRTIMRVIAIQKGVRVRVSVLSGDEEVVVEEPTPQEEVPQETPESQPAPAEDSLSVEV